MDNSIALAAICLLLIASVSALKIVRKPRVVAAVELRALRGALRQAQVKYGGLQEQGIKLREAWLIEFNTVYRTRPVAIMLEIKQIDRVLERAHEVEQEVQKIRKRAATVPPAEVHQCVKQIWQQISILSVSQTDIVASKLRLRNLQNANARDAEASQVAA